MENLLHRLTSPGRPRGPMLVALWLVCAVSASGQYDGPFSHQKHLGYGAVCADCHPKATTSTEATDNLLPVLDVCMKCHGPGSIKAPRRLTVTKFNHQLHAGIPGIGKLIAASVRSGEYLGQPPDGYTDRLEAAQGCTVCHHGIETSDKVDRGVFPAMADCLVCHSEVDAPFSCEKCHDAGADLEPVSHTPQYLEQHSRPGALQDKSTCATCHGRRFTCLGCH